jgi:hypothetical protein
MFFASRNIQRTAPLYHLLTAADNENRTAA